MGGVGFTRTSVVHWVVVDGDGNGLRCSCCLRLTCQLHVGLVSHFALGRGHSHRKLSTTSFATCNREPIARPPHVNAAPQSTSIRWSGTAANARGDGGDGHHGHARAWRRSATGGGVAGWVAGGVAPRGDGSCDDHRRGRSEMSRPKWSVFGKLRGWRGGGRFAHSGWMWFRQTRRGGFLMHPPDETGGYLT